MKCSTRTCTRNTQVREPLPLCRVCVVRVMAAYAAVILGGSEPEVREVRQNDAQDEIRTIFQLLDMDGWNQVDLNRAMEVLNRPKATASHRLAEARRQYAAELNRRAGRNRRESEIDAVYAQILQAGDPKAVSLEDVMGLLGLKQTTAWDRLSTAQQIWADAQQQTAWTGTTPTVADAE